MGITQIHPNCELERPLTPGEMLEMINYEGLVGLGDPEDLKTAQELAVLGLVEVVSDPVDSERGIPHIVSTQVH